MYLREISVVNAIVFSSFFLVSLGQENVVLAQVSSAMKERLNSAHINLKGPSPKITLRNISPTHRLNSVNIKKTNHPLVFELTGGASCGPKEIETKSTRIGTFLEKVTFGVGPLEDQYWSEIAFENQDTKVWSYKGHRELVVPQSIFEKTVHKIDARKLFLSKVMALRSSDKRLVFLKKNQRVQTKIPIRVEAVCRDYKFNKITGKMKFSSRTSIVSMKLMPVQIHYKADPKLTGRLAPKLKAGTVEKITKPAASSFFKIRTAEIASGPKNLRGKCPIAGSFEAKLNGTGDGAIILEVVEGRSVIYKSRAIKFRDGHALHKFEILNGKSGQDKIYTQYPHKLKIQVYTKSVKSQRFSAFPKKLGGVFYWQHNCISLTSE